MGILTTNTAKGSNEVNPNGDSSWVKEKIISETNANVTEIAKWVEKLFAEKKHAILLILQGMDASGKDSLTKAIFSKVSPTWVNVVSFKKPAEIELAHDFLWRIHKGMPEKGTITVFNRSYYEDILIPSVYGSISNKEISNRYGQINDFEKMLEENNIHVIKVYLNLSFERQEEKLLERIHNITKHWKHSDEDWETRKHWDKFMKVYEKIFVTCNAVKWNIVPSNKSWMKNYAVSKILLERLKEIKPKFPALVSEKFGTGNSK